MLDSAVGTSTGTSEDVLASFSGRRRAIGSHEHDETATAWLTAEFPRARMGEPIAYVGADNVGYWLARARSAGRASVTTLSVGASVVFVASASGETLPPRWHDYSSNAVFSALLFPATNPSHRYVGQTDEPPIDPRIVARFSDLKRQWKESAARLHSGSEMFLHPAYQMIIGMGKQVLPLILRDLERDLDHWFWALKAITGADPCTDDMRGNLSAMRTTWLDWASKQGFRW